MTRIPAPALLATALLASAAAGAGLTYLLTRTPGLDGDDAAQMARPAPAAAGGVVLTAAQQHAAGLRLARPEPAIGGSAITGYARALDLSALSAIAADLAAGQAALTASGREAERLAALVRSDAGASQRELDAARAQVTADRARVDQACRRAGLEYGPGIARLGCGRLGALARAAAAGELALLRVDVPGQVLASGAAVVLDLAPGKARVILLGPASAGDTALQSGGMLALLEGSAAARVGIGRVLQATLPGQAGQPGLLFPRSALVRVDGGLFAWRAVDGQHFVRMPLTGAIADERGWIVPAAAWPGEQPVVVRGAGTLLGLEHAAPPAGDD